MIDIKFYREFLIKVLISANIFTLSFSFLGWVLDSPLLRSIVPGRAPIMMMTIILLFLLTIGTVTNAQTSPLKKHVKNISNFFASFFSLLVLLDYYLIFVHAFTFFPAEHMTSPQSAIAIFLVATSNLFIDKEIRIKLKHLDQALIVLSAQISLFAFIGHIFDVAPLYSISARIGMSVNTLICMSSLTFCAFIKKHDTGFSAIVFDNSVVSNTLRKFLIVSLVLPIITAIITKYLIEMEYLTMTTSITFFVLLLISGLYLFSFLLALKTRELEIKKNDFLVSEFKNKTFDQLLKMKEEFLAISTHELRTPITGLSFAIDYFNEFKKIDKNGNYGPSEVIENSMTTIEKSKDQLSNIINSISNYAKYSYSKIKISNDEFNLSNVINDSIDKFRSQIHEMQIKVNTDIHPEVLITGDPEKMEVVMDNLLSNAIKYGKSKPISIKLSQLDNLIQLQVKDEGSGVSAKNINRIFFPFERAHHASDVSGIGIGLYISREIVKLHHGDIRIEANEGDGACFIVELPRKLAT